MATSMHLGTSTDGTPAALDPAAFTTHAFVLGMTGSGKTGLCAVLVEEILANQVPIIAVDSKGDLATLLLRFGADDTKDLTAWSPDAKQAASSISQTLWTLGRTPAQDAAVRAQYEGRLYTPGSTVGLPLNLLGGLAPPADTSPEGLAAASEAFARALLALLAIDVDPLSSREFLLLSEILNEAWKQGKTLTLTDVVRQVAQPPFQVVGALPLEVFFPARDRQALMVRVNALVASPKLMPWAQGEPFDPAILFYGARRQPRLSVFSVAHLEDAERVQVVAMLLTRVVSWMRKQGGANGLRAVLLIDEIFGYFPPSPANPPTKAPLIALLKQARAFGLSVVLATQNPIDLDYRGLANIGTWMVGRLQTEQDKARIRDALAAAAAASGAKGGDLDATISKLEKRQFLLQSISLPAPTVFRSRDALTLLHGPFSEEEMRTLAAPMRGVASVPPTSAGGGVEGAAKGPSSAAAGGTATCPLSGLDAELGPIFTSQPGAASLYLYLKYAVRFRVGGTTTEETVQEVAYPVGSALNPEEVLENAPQFLKGVSIQDSQPPGLTFGTVPPWVQMYTSSKLKNAVKERLPSKLQAKLWSDPASKLMSLPGESREEFAARVAKTVGGSKQVAAISMKLEKRRADLAQLQSQLTQRTAQKWLDVGVGMLDIFTGARSRGISKAGKAMSSQRMQGAAQGRVEDVQLEITQLEGQLAAAQGSAASFEEKVAYPRAADVQLLRASWLFRA